MIVLITGGQRSGKSSFAEKILQDFNDVVYFATAENCAKDGEMNARIKTHQERRNKNWRTVETYKNFAKYLGQENNYLLDCVTNTVSRFMFEFTEGREKINEKDFNKIFTAIKKTFTELFEAVNKQNLKLYLVTNEVGSATIPMNSIARAFVDLQGLTNSFLASLADEVYFCVSGIPIKIK